MKVEVASYSNTFFEYLRSFIWFSQDRLTAMMERYSIGATDQGDGSTGHPIFWHINVAHQITNGHIITMDSKTGKVYDNSWYYQDKQPTCLFGEHLLLDFPDKTVALVKDEMTAAIMSCFPTPYLWLATGKDFATESIKGEPTTTNSFGGKFLFFSNSLTYSSDFAKFIKIFS